MKPITLLIIITVALSSCAAADAILVNAETEQTQAETERAEVDAAADTQGDLVNLVNRLLDELGDERANTGERFDALLAVIEDFAEIQKPAARWDVVGLAVVIAAVIVWRDRQKPRVVIVSQAQLGDGSTRGSLLPGEQWQMRIPQDVDVEVER